MSHNLRNAEDYIVGIEVDSGHVGWSVIGADGELYRFKGQPTWGVRCFTPAQHAEDARLARGQRRRYSRRKQRIGLLQGFFAEEMDATDPEFFVRLAQARLLPEDRTAGRYLRWTLFDGGAAEPDYYAKYPTIFHLRAHLMEEEEPDVRLVYLALHSIVKHRGNFLHEDVPGLSAADAGTAASAEALVSALEALHGEEGACDAAAVRAAMEDMSLTRKGLRDALWPLLLPAAGDKATAKAAASAVAGLKADFGALLGLGEKLSASLDGGDKEDEIRAACPDEAAELLEALASARSARVLAGILKGADGKTLSYCKMAEHERYGEDLATLKALVREYAPGDYGWFFRGPLREGAKGYDPFKARGYTLYDLGKTAYDDFAKEVAKLLSGTGAESDPRYAAMSARLAEGTFLRRLRTRDNASVPHQLHLEEMRAIIDRQSRLHPFLAEHRREIESLVTFRIPYYVGPLTTKNARRAGDDPEGEARFAWSVRKEGKEGERVYPWNWDEVIDKGASAEAFIRRMTGTCTYLAGEPVLPRHSLLYESFCALNELNGARWWQDDKEHRFGASDRAAIYEELFKRGSVTYKKVEDWLARNGKPMAHVGGGQGESRFESKLTAHLFFKDVLGVDDIEGETAEMVEELILWSTLFEDRGIMREKVEEKYGDVLDARQVDRVCKKRFTGWGKLSAKFLRGIEAETSAGPVTVMDVLEWGQPDGRGAGRAMTLMEVLTDASLGFSDVVDEENRKAAEAAGGLTPDDLPGSPALRRGVNQALRVVDEIAGIAGKPPAAIYVELVRDGGDKRRKGKRTDSRRDALAAGLAALGRDGAEVLAELEAAGDAPVGDREYLYFSQNGRCLYSGKRLDVRRVRAGDGSCVVSRIVPGAYGAAGGLGNSALVAAGEERRRSGDLLLDPSVQQRMARTWRALNAAGLLSDRKLANLECDRLGEGRAAGLAGRQAVERGQVARLVKLMLEERFPGAEVAPVKESLVRQMRAELGLAKGAEANDFHHAHDALIAAEIGRFTRIRHDRVLTDPIVARRAMLEFVRSQDEAYRRSHRMPGSASFVIGSFMTPGFDEETGEVFKDTWDAAAETARIARCLGLRQCRVSRMPEVTSGAFWKQTVFSPRDPSKKDLIPQKSGLDPSKYGGYSGKGYAYFFLYRMEKRGKEVLDMGGVPLNVAASVEGDPAALERYAAGVAAAEGGSLVSVERAPVYKQQLVEVDGCLLRVTGLNEVRNGTQIALDAPQRELLARVCSGAPTEPGEREALWAEVVGKLPRVAPRLGSLLKLDGSLGDFRKAGEAAQRKLIRELVDLVNGRNRQIDLTALGGKKNTGALILRYRKVTSSSEFAVIDQSVTGMFETRTEYRA